MKGNTTCLSCGRDVHNRHRPECRGCRRGRGLCSSCYGKHAWAGTLDQFPTSVRPTGVKRDCACPRARHRHGTRQAYVVDGCGCGPCVTAYRSYEKRRHVLGPSCTVDPVGSVRRVRALVAIGWSFRDLSARLGMHPKYLGKLHRVSFVYLTTADRIRVLYDQLSMVSAPKSYGAVRARNLAARRGWPPPLAWDDGCIDDPDAVPWQDTHSPVTVDSVVVERWVTGDRKLRLNPAERVEVARRLLADGWSGNRIQSALRMNGQTWRTVRREALGVTDEAA